MRPFSFEKREEEELLLLDFFGKLPKKEALPIEKELTETVSGERNRILISVEGVDGIGTGGICLLYRLAKRVLKDQGKIALTGLRNSDWEMIVLSGLKNSFSIVASAEEGRAVLKAKT